MESGMDAGVQSQVQGVGDFPDTHEDLVRAVKPGCQFGAVVVVDRRLAILRRRKTQSPTVNSCSECFLFHTSASDLGRATDFHGEGASRHLDHKVLCARGGLVNNPVSIRKCAVEGIHRPLQKESFGWPNGRWYCTTIPSTTPIQPKSWVCRPQSYGSSALRCCLRPLFSHPIGGGKSSCDKAESRVA